MAELPSNYITITSIANTLGQPVPNALVSSLVDDVNVNPWSFYRPVPITLNASDEVILGTANRYYVGDFRRYDHTENPPSLNPVIQNLDYETVTAVAHRPIPSGLNVKELDNSNALYWCVRYYSNTTDRANRTGFTRTKVLSTSDSSQQDAAVQYSTETPPSGHRNNQTQKALAPSVLFDWDFPIPTSDKTYYSEVYLGSFSGFPYIYMPDEEWYGTINFSTSETTPPPAPAFKAGLNIPVGPGICYPVYLINGTPCQDNTTPTVEQIPGSTTYQANLAFKGQYNTTVGAYTVSNLTITLKLYNENNSLLETWTHGTQITVYNYGYYTISGTLPNGRTWQDGYYIIPSWSAYNPPVITACP